MYKFNIIINNPLLNWSIPIVDEESIQNKDNTDDDSISISYTNRYHNVFILVPSL